MRSRSNRVRGLVAGVMLVTLGLAPVGATAGATTMTAARAATVETYPGQVGLWAVTATAPYGNERIRLTPVGTRTGVDLARGSEPDWSPNGRKIAFVRDGALYTMRADGSRVTRVTVGAHAPAWSPDGRRIAFAGDYGDLWTVHPDGTVLTRLTDDNAGDAEPAWSPDGTRIAFTSMRTGTRELFVMAANGTGISALTADGSADEHSPDWSPDGSRIAFERAGSLDTIDADGGGQAVLAVASRTALSSPSWSPDGGQVAFVADSGPTTMAVGTVDADGTDLSLSYGGSERLGTVDWQSVPALDHGAPKIDWLEPAHSGEVYARFSRHVARCRCSDPSGVLYCTAVVTKPGGAVKEVADGAPLPTAAVGRYTMQVRAQDAAFNDGTASVTYDVRR